MAQTPDGYLWFGTFDGLVRFDGVKFTVFNPRNTPELPSAGIVNIHADQRGWLWVSTYEGLVVRTGSEWRAFGKAQGWPGNYVRTFAERRNGDLLITTFNGTVLEFARGSLAALREPPGVQGNGYFGFVDGKDQWWVAQNGFVGRWDGQRWNRIVPSADMLNIPGEWVYGAAARDGGWWLLLNKELRKYQGDAEVHRIQLPERPRSIWSLFEDSRTNLWICTQRDGVCKVAPDGAMRCWNKENGLPATSTRFAFEDLEQNVWIGTSGGGLLRFKPRRFQSFGLESGLTERVVRSVAVHPDGSVLIGTYGGGLFRLGQAGSTFLLKDQANPFTPSLHSVLADRTGRTWVAGNATPWLWISGTNGLTQIPKEQFSGNVFALFEDSRGRIWAGDDKGVSVFDAQMNSRYGRDHGLPNGTVRCFGEDNTGGLWLSNWKGLFRLENERWVELRDDTNGPITEVACFKSGPGTTLWMGTLNDGLVRRKDGKVARVRVEHGGLPVASIRSILEDDAHYFWMGTDRGVLRIHRQQLDNAADGLVKRLNYQLFDSGDGLPSAECTGEAQPTSARDSRGRMWFATPKGVAMVDPARFYLNTNPPPVRIESLVYHTSQRNRARSMSDTTTLNFESPPDRVVMPPGSRLIEVHYAALSFTASEKIRFQVQLEGLDNDWHEPVKQHMAFFHDLPPGGYTFRVRASNNDGVWNETGASLAFTLLPFFWQTTWFRAFCVAMLAGALLLWYRNQMAKVEARRLAQEAFTRQLITAQEAERSRLARELHDDITQRVARLAIDAGCAERRENGPEMVETMRTVRENLVQLSDDIHALSYRLHPAVLQDLGLATALKCECEEFSRRTSIPAQATVAELPPGIPEDAALCLFRIAQEALHNVGRHSHSKTAEVSLRPSDGGLQLEVTDTGVGFDMREKDRVPSLGLAGMRERVRLLGGELDIDSGPGRGTTILAWVPLKL